MITSRICVLEGTFQLTFARHEINRLWRAILVDSACPTGWHTSNTESYCLSTGPPQALPPQLVQDNSSKFSFLGLHVEPQVLITQEHMQDGLSRGPNSISESSKTLRMEPRIYWRALSVFYSRGLSLSLRTMSTGF